MFDQGRSSPARAAHIRSIKGWTRQVLSLPEETVVMATELRCTEPGCPPLETIVAVMAEAGGGQRQFKIHKALEGVTYEDIATGAAALLRGEPHRHDDPAAAR